MIIIYNKMRKKCALISISKKLGEGNLASTSLDSAMELVKVTLMNVGVRYDMPDGFSSNMCRACGVTSTTWSFLPEISRFPRTPTWRLERSESSGGRYPRNGKSIQRFMDPIPSRFSISFLKKGKKYSRHISLMFNSRMILPFAIDFHN